MPLTLRDYLKKHPPGSSTRCSMCALPPKLLAEIHKDYDEIGARPQGIWGFLRELGHKVGIGSVKHHFQGGHHRKKR